MKEFKKLREFIGGKTALNSHDHHHHHYHDDDHIEGFWEFDDGDHKKKKGKRGDKSKKRGGKSNKKNQGKDKGNSFSSSNPNKAGLNIKFLDSAVTS